MRLDNADKKLSAAQPFTEKMYAAQLPRAKPAHHRHHARAAVDSFAPAAPRPAAAAALSSTQSAAPAAAAQMNTAAASSGVWYTVQGGDTLTAIAQRYNTTVDAIVRANNIPNPDAIQVGQQLWIPQDSPPPPPPPGTGSLTNEPNHQFSLNETWPYIKKYSNAYGFDPHVLAGAVMQESTFKNFLVHYDGHGHGLLGLDDRGLLSDFESWVRTSKGVPDYSAGRGSSASSIPPEWQIEYAAKTLAQFSRTYGGDYMAARVWHTGPGGRNSEEGVNYERLIRGHVANLFANGDPPDALPAAGTRASFQGYNGNYMVAENGGGANVNVNRPAAGPWETFNIVDLNGGSLESGDAINIQTQNGDYMVAENGGGGAVNANRTKAAQWEQFRLVEVGGDGHIQDGDKVALQTWDGQHWVCAEGGGGREAVANRTVPAAWETFTYHAQP